LGDCERENFSTPLTRVEDLRAAIKDFISGFQQSALKKMSRRTWGNIKICAENGGERTDNITSIHRHFIATLYCIFLLYVLYYGVFSLLISQKQTKRETNFTSIWYNYFSEN
jgi:hypothetical protein